jgi:hypothetical protein
MEHGAHMLRSNVLFDLIALVHAKGQAFFICTFSIFLVFQ